jgi:hypothetical protein
MHFGLERFSTEARNKGFLVWTGNSPNQVIPLGKVFKERAFSERNDKTAFSDIGNLGLSWVCRKV